jgi:hypothetical protein
MRVRQGSSLQSQEIMPETEETKSQVHYRQSEYGSQKNPFFGVW